MTTPAVAPEHKTTRRKSSVVAAALATAFLTSMSLIGGQTPAFADDAPTYASDQEVTNAMATTDPVNSWESSWGYPTGLEQDSQGNVKVINSEDARSAYASKKDDGTYETAQESAEHAVKDAQGQAKSYADDASHDSALRESAQHLVDGWSGTTKPAGTELRQNTNDDELTGGQHAKDYCNMTSQDSQSSAGQAPPCMFVGYVTEKYPQRGASQGIMGEGKLTYKVSASVADEQSTTNGWQAGGKVTPKIVDDGGGTEGELNFTYSRSTTSTTKVQSTQESDIEINVPQGKKGYLEGRANGATYTGYLVVRYIDTSNQQEHLVAIPARAYVQAPGSSSPVTWVKRLEDAS
ncbi:hypothetical protein ACFVZM_22735 [Streptomyces sioyaensis]|uniref:hypothetical protein n=1 Tax=Streptomyces sioyaensis TaxID=67364 RepID=UPI0036769CDE